jgi:hypothetical protein
MADLYEKIQCIGESRRCPGGDRLYVCADHGRGVKACGNNLSRENRDETGSQHSRAETADVLPGITLSTSANDFNPIKQMQLQRFDGTTWKLFGEVMSASGS